MAKKGDTATLPPNRTCGKGSTSNGGLTTEQLGRRVTSLLNSGGPVQIYRAPTRGVRKKEMGDQVSWRGSSPTLGSFPLSLLQRLILGPIKKRREMALPQGTYPTRVGAFQRRLYSPRDSRSTTTFPMRPEHSRIFGEENSIANMSLSRPFVSIPTNV